eukprot:TRINITY_DN2281_c0_g1_i1.p1 TRINITY_DN2281_c0_g1~~TRINITY_DN2281_c0_g1_i1.p1  ORF type:complete len:200 (+),score=51.54 TRINITY_DN2281_c0_g1_i1:73-672(+)
MQAARRIIPTATTSRLLQSGRRSFLRSCDINTSSTTSQREFVPKSTSNPYFNAYTNVMRYGGTSAFAMRFAPVFADEKAYRTELPQDQVTGYHVALVPERKITPAALGSLGGILGFAAGYAAKKSIKAVLILVGAQFMFLQALAYVGFIHIDWNRVLDVDYKFRAKHGNPTSSLKTIFTHNLPFKAGALAGFALGFRQG